MRFNLTVSIITAIMALIILKEGISTLTLKEKITTATLVGGVVTLMGTILITTTEPTSI